ncbi:pyridoxal-phosphate dependent enzyme [Nocardia sp. NPDC052566]|uniref:pyridoxal-phosphate dependent enzyme n=1 Tax=Nocardia sp. NPDC052566 TaxID=3364330 RepID=UPI0037CC43CF
MPDSQLHQRFPELATSLPFLRLGAATPVRELALGTRNPLWCKDDGAYGDGGYGLRLPYYLPVGGSNPIGALGYVEGALELAAQIASGALPEPARVVTAVGSGGTAAGLALGLRIAGLRTRVLGVVVNDTLPLDAPDIVALANRSADVLRSRGAQLDIDPLRPDDVTMVRDWLGPGYGHETPEAVTARTRAATAGLRLETVYTAKGLAAALDLDTRANLGDGPLLLLNTYGPRP